MPRTLARRILAGAVVGLLAAGACGGRGGGEAASRLLAVHNVMRATGRTWLGAVSQGSLAEGQEARLALKLGSACATIVAFGGPGTRDIALKLLGPDGQVVAQETALDSQAVLTACVDRPGDYVAVVTMASGSGEYVASTFSGGSDVPALAGSAQAVATGGTCDAPAMLVAGQMYNGTTEDGPDDLEGSCGNSSGKERVYRLDLATRQRISMEVEARFDSVLYIRKGDCSDRDAEVACNDDAPGGSNHSKISAVLDPGTYYAIVDGYRDSGGTYKLRMTAQNAPSAQEICGAARQLAAGATVVGHMTNTFDNSHATCGGGAKGPDVVYRMDIAARSRVRITEKSGDFHPIVHLQRACEDDKTALGCAAGSDEAVWAGVLDAGTYWVYADSSEDGATGTFTLTAETAPEGGAATAGSVKGDSCGDAIALTDASGSVDGDTFLAREDAVVSCGRPGAPDIAYRVDLKHKSRLTARFAKDEASHAVAVTKACGDRAAELSCSRTAERVLEPGTYFLVVDSKGPESMGRYSLSYRITDLALGEAACAHVGALAVGKPLHGTTVGAGNRFTATCGTKGPSGTAPDRVFKFTVAKSVIATVTLDTKGFPGVLSVRKTCADESTETQCATGSDEPTHVQIRNRFNAGTYYAVVDGAGKTGGAFTLRVEEEK